MIERLFRKGLDEIKPYVPGRGKESVPKGVKAVKLASNENPLGPSNKVLATLRGIEKSAVNIYPDSMGRKLRSAISKYVGVKEDSIIIGNGSDEALELAVKVFLNRGEKAVIPVPTFSLYENIVKVYSGEPVYVPLTTDFEYDVKRIINAVDEGTKMVFVCSPNNPTGSVMPSEDLKHLLEEEIVVILDEAYAEFADESNAKLVNEYENLVVLRTFSKAFGLAGLRVGYAIADEKVAAFMDKVRLPFSVNTLAQAAALASLEDAEHLEKSVFLARTGRDHLYRELSKIQSIKVFPSQGNFLLVNTPKRPDVTAALLEKGIIARDCSGFRGLNSEYFRVSIGTEEENELLLGALKKIMG
ncbi:MAG: histidinol-phosphate transaminase [Candidatus Hydrothermarchaeaceae archaeon]